MQTQIVENGWESDPRVYPASLSSCSCLMQALSGLGFFMEGGSVLSNSTLYTPGPVRAMSRAIKNRSPVR